MYPKFISSRLLCVVNYVDLKDIARIPQSVVMIVKYFTMRIRAEAHVTRIYRTLVCNVKHVCSKIRHNIARYFKLFCIDQGILHRSRELYKTTALGCNECRESCKTTNYCIRYNTIAPYLCLALNIVVWSQSWYRHLALFSLRLELHVVPCTSKKYLFISIPPVTIPNTNKEGKSRVSLHIELTRHIVDY